MLLLAILLIDRKLTHFDFVFLDILNDVDLFE